MTTRMLLLLITAAVCACNNRSTIDTKAEGDKLMQISRNWSRVAGTDSIDRILSYWADDATLIETDQPMVKGKDALRAMVSDVKKIPGFRISWEPISAKISEGGDMGYLLEKSQMTFLDSSGKPVTVHSQGVTIWRKDAAGNWKDVVDMSSREPVEKK